ncbi:aldehyde dehydrogenase family protein, partial [Pseudomonas syringae pv. actinidiae]|nr:aldehyde dehydrogenase family protein [Pseudomonas syringae pv. actinidiae]
FYRPTVLSGVKPGMRAFEEEIFGPVAVVVSFSSDEQASSWPTARNTGWRLRSISPDVGRATALGDRLRCGMLHINDQTVADECINSFGGRGASATAAAQAALLTGMNTASGSGSP